MDLDQLADQHPHCFQNRMYMASAWNKLTVHERGLIRLILFFKLDQEFDLSLCVFMAIF